MPAAAGGHGGGSREWVGTCAGGDKRVVCRESFGVR